MRFSSSPGPAFPELRRLRSSRPGADSAGSTALHACLSTSPYVVVLHSPILPDPKPTKSQMHLDLRTPEIGPEVERIRAAGGVVVTGEPMAEFGFRWQILADPDGNELRGGTPAGYWPP